MRDLMLERERVTALLRECPSVSDVESFVSEEEALAFLSKLRIVTVPHALEWPESTSLNLRGHVTRKSLQGRLRGNKGWYLATGGVRLDDVTQLTLDELVRAPAVGNGRFLRLANGDYVEVEERIRRVMAALAPWRDRP